MLQGITLLMTNCHLRKITIGGTFVYLEIRSRAGLMRRKITVGVGGALAPTTPNPQRNPAAALTGRNETKPWRTHGKAFGRPIEADGNMYLYLITGSLLLRAPAGRSIARPHVG